MRNSLLVGIGAAVAVAALPELAGTALASNPDVVYLIELDDGSNGGEYLCQSDWWYCVKCSVIYHSDNDAPGGVCPEGGTHQNDTSYTLYCIPHDGGSMSQTEAPVNGVQAGWRWCSRCQGLFWGSAASVSVCPAGGHHVVTSGTYVYDLPYGKPYISEMINGVQDDITGQTDWLYCGQCRGLFYGHNNTISGVCPAGGPHSQASNSSNYYMPPYVNPVIV